MTQQKTLVQEELEADVRAGLTAEKKHVPSKYLYDRLGSILFEAICVLPEYYLTRTEHRILEKNGADIVSRIKDDAWLVELGAGSAIKTQLLIEQMLKHRASLVYCPIDISKEALRTAEANTVSRFPQVSFEGIQGDWFEVLGRLTSMQTSQKLIAFLGSSIGNLTQDDAIVFLDRLAAKMGVDDQVLLGTDMVKAPEELLPAYDDAAGVTAAFNRNLLVRLNHELDADFDTSLYRHEARWNPEARRVEMHLVARQAHTVRLARLDMEVAFEQDESIHTENSHKFTPESIDQIVTASGLTLIETWHDADDRFRLNLLGKAT